VAQVWQFSQFDDGAYIYGDAYPAGLGGFGLSCNVVSPQGRNPVEVGAHEITRTAPFTAVLNLPVGWIAMPATGYQRGDVVIWVDQTGYRLPVVSMNRLIESWEAPVALSDPLIRAMESATRLVVAPGGETALEVPTGGIGPAIDAMRRPCVQAAAAIGLAAQPGLQAPPAPGAIVGDAMMQALQLRLATGCTAGVQGLAENAVMGGDIDGDGARDLMLNWAEVTCVGDDFTATRPFCGAATCSVDVFLTRLYPQRGEPEMLLSIGVSLETRADGGIDIVFGRALRECGDPASGVGCEGRLRWIGSDLEFIE